MTIILGGISRRSRDQDLPAYLRATLSGFGTMEAAVFGLYSLLLAFTFSGAPARLDARRQLIVQEGNVIGTAYLRLDLLPAELQPAFRERFRKYLDSRPGDTEIRIHQAVEIR